MRYPNVNNLQMWSWGTVPPKTMNATILSAVVSPLLFTVHPE